MEESRFQASEALHRVQLEIFVKSRTSCLSKLNVLPSFCFPNASLVCTLYCRCICKETLWNGHFLASMTTIYVESLDSHPCPPHHLFQFTKSQFTTSISQFIIHKFTIHKESGIFLHDNQVHRMGLDKWDSTYMMASWLEGS